MVLKSKIDFSNRYEVTHLSNDLRVSQFNAILENDHSIPLQVGISAEEHELLEKVFNMSFGPLNAKGKIDDKVQLPHKDPSKTFSTILYTTLTYLSAYPSHGIGIDGSTNSRAFLYYRVLQQNFDYLNQRFKMYGLKYYVRISRLGKNQYDNPFDFWDIKSDPEKIRKGVKIPSDQMYNYLVLKLKKQKFILMEQTVEQMVQASIEKAKKEGKVMKVPKSTTPSSLHQIIRTPEQARRFMLMLELADKYDL